VVVQKSLIVIPDMHRDPCYFYCLCKITECVVEDVDLVVPFFVVQHNVVTPIIPISFLGKLPDVLFLNQSIPLFLVLFDDLLNLLLQLNNGTCDLVSQFVNEIRNESYEYNHEHHEWQHELALNLTGHGVLYFVKFALNHVLWQNQHESIGLGGIVNQ